MKAKAWHDFFKGPETALNNKASRIAFLYTDLRLQDINDRDN